MKCNAHNNQTIPCEGKYMPSEGCCLRHAVLFDFWISEQGGFQVYNTDYPRRWKRSKFHQWLNTLSLKQAKGILDH